MAKMMGIPKNRKIPEFPGNSINAGNSQKLNILGGFPVLGGILAID